MTPKNGSTTAKSLTQKQPLDRNHALIFKQLLQNYETKEYKKGIKNADIILKKYPNDGETMAMKGLILTNIDKKDEGWEYVRKGLRNDLKSHICWHVYGLLYRADKNYEESMKCYVNALKFDPDNLVVLRDLAVIQSQLRILPGLVDTRKSLILRQPEVRGHHTALAVAYHLQHDFANAAKVLQDFDESMPIKPKNNTEHSMTTLFHNSVLAQSGDFKKALTHITAVEDQVLDKLEILERQAKYNLELEQFDQARALYERLLDINPDCYRYYTGLDRALQYRLPDGSPIETMIDSLKKHYIALQSRYPKSSAARRLPLNWLSGEVFRLAIDQYVINLLQKGVPSTFADVKALYKIPWKANTIEELVESYLERLRSSPGATLNGDNESESASNGDVTHEAPTSYLWTLYFLAQSYDQRRKLDKATQMIDEALQHTPTLVELHLTKARILKHSGSPILAAEQMNTARELDLQDRFINTKSTKYYLRADQNGEAINTIALFVNSTLGGGSIGDLQEMQSINYLVEDGLSYLRQSLLGLALKRFQSVKRTIDQWFDDQFDFHQYCFRKGTIDAYIATMEWEHTVYNHVVYRRAAEGAVKALLRLHRDPELRNGPKELSTASDSEKKKEKKRIQKIRARCSKDATREAEKKDGVDMHRKLDVDPVGDQLVATSTPLGDALSYLKPWLRDAPNDHIALALAAEIYIEQTDYRSAVQVLSKLDDRQAHYLLYLMRSRIEASEDSDPERDERVNELLKERFADRGTAQWNQDFLDSAATAEELLDGLRVRAQLGGNGCKEDIESRIFNQVLDMTRTSLHQARAMQDLLRAVESARVQEYWSRIKEVWYNAEE